MAGTRLVLVHLAGGKEESKTRQQGSEVLMADKQRALKPDDLMNLRRILLGAMVFIDRLLEIPPDYPNKEERRLLLLMRKGSVNVEAVRQFVETQLT